MKVSNYIISALGLAPLAAATIVTAKSEEFEVAQRDIFAELSEEIAAFSQEHLSKRADSPSSIESLLLAVNQSGIIFQTVDSIATSQPAMDNLANLLISVLKSNSSASSMLSSLNISLNVSDILETVKASGIITTIADGLLLNDQNRQAVAAVAGDTLANHVWASKILQGLGDGKDLTVDYIADTVKNTVPKGEAANSTDSSKEAVFTNAKRAESTSGSYQTFVNNLVNAALASQALSISLDGVLAALNDTGLGLSLVMQGLNSTSLRTIGSYVLPKVYNSGALDNIDLNTFYQHSKKSGLTANALQSLFTNEKYAPPVALIFKQMEDQGVFEKVRLHLYG
ncbi:hypothetical protein CAAN1_27S00408 [[Candida] anglica]|uniref:Opaque-phase-specific protein OP4 n=1 Tax=[Candida] anglica TaxID=148631 RepID=A0ABP0EB28_9ASCO